MIDADTILELAESDPNFATAAAIILVGQKIAYEIKYLGNGDAATQMGAIEALGDRLGKSIEAVAAAVERLADVSA